MSRSAARRFWIGLPSSRMSPLSISSRPAMARSVVVLPQPEGPRNTTNSRSLTVRLTSRMTWTGPKCLSLWRSSISAMVAALHGGGSRDRGGVVFVDPRAIGRRDVNGDVEADQADEHDQHRPLVQELDPWLAEKDDARQH